jgi:hypothetical protein
LTPAQETLKKWREDPRIFVREVFKVIPDKWQDRVLEKFPSQKPDEQRISMQACAGPGKTAVHAWCGWNFLLCYGRKGEHPKGASVSVTNDNLKDNLWPEFAKWQNRSELLRSMFTWTKTRIFAKHHPETWFLSARSWSKTSDAEEQGRTLSGLHSEFVLALIDESGEIPVSVLKAAEQALSNCVWGKILQAGNPTSLEGMLYAASTILRNKWYVVCINGDPDDPERSNRIDVAWAREQIATYGRDNPWVMSYILGKFPPSSINTLLGPEEVEAAIKRSYKFEAYGWSEKRLGIDAARFGDDPWIIFPRQGLMAFKCVPMRNPRSDEVAARVVAGKLKWGSDKEFFDGTGGFASGAIDAMILAGHTPLEVHFSGKAIDPRYYNKRSEMWFNMANWIKNGGSLPNDSELIKELTAPTYTFVKGKFLLEEKAQIKDRLKFSPNKGDALGLTFALPDMPKEDAMLAKIRNAGGGNDRVKHEWDPYDSDRI